jgi:chromosome segregation ATPase
MKMKAILPSLLLFTLSGLKAQVSNQAEIVNTSIESASGESVKVLVNRAEDKDLMDAWKSLMKAYDAEDLKTKRKRGSATNVLIPAISTNKINVYAEVDEESKTALSLSSIFVEGELNLSATEAAKNMMVVLAREVSREATEDYLKEQEKALSALKSDLKDLKRDKERAEKSIDKCEKTIKESEKQLKKNEKEVVEVQENVETLSEGLSKTTDNEEMKKQEKALFSAQKDLKNLRRSNEKSTKDIEKCKAEIKDKQYELKQNEKDTKKTEKQIKEQEKVVEAAKEEVSFYR